MAVKELTIDHMVADQYTIIGKVHQVAYVLEHLKKQATEAVDVFSNYDEGDNEQFARAVKESLDSVDIIEDAIEDIRTLLEWMVIRREQIFNVK